MVSRHRYQAQAYLKSKEADIWRNRGELAEGWYGPQMLAKAEEFVAEHEPAVSAPHNDQDAHPRRNNEEDDSSDDSMPGPALPGQEMSGHGKGRSTKKSGPAIPNMQDLDLQRGRLLLPL